MTRPRSSTLSSVASGRVAGYLFAGCPMWWIEVLLAASLIVAALAMIADTRGTL